MSYETRGLKGWITSPSSTALTNCVAPKHMTNSWSNCTRGAMRDYRAVRTKTDVKSEFGTVPESRTGRS